MPTKGTDGREPSFSHREIIYLPLTISPFPNYRTTQPLRFLGAGTARPPAVTDPEFEVKKAESRPSKLNFRMAKWIF